MNRSGGGNSLGASSVGSESQQCDNVVLIALTQPVFKALCDVCVAGFNYPEPARLFPGNSVVHIYAAVRGDSVLDSSASLKRVIVSKVETDNAEDVSDTVTHLMHSYLPTTILILDECYGKQDDLIGNVRVSCATRNDSTITGSSARVGVVLRNNLEWKHLIPRMVWDYANKAMAAQGLACEKDGSFTGRELRALLGMTEDVADAQWGDFLDHLKETRAIVLESDGKFRVPRAAVDRIRRHLACGFQFRPLEVLKKIRAYEKDLLPRSALDVLDLVKALNKSYEHSSRLISVSAVVAVSEGDLQLQDFASYSAAAWALTYVGETYLRSNVESSASGSNSQLSGTVDHLSGGGSADTSAHSVHSTSDSSLPSECEMVQPQNWLDMERDISTISNVVEFREYVALVRKRLHDRSRIGIVFMESKDLDVETFRLHFDHLVPENQRGSLQMKNVISSFLGIEGYTLVSLSYTFDAREICILVIALTQLESSDLRVFSEVCALVPAAAIQCQRIQCTLNFHMNKSIQATLSSVPGICTKGSEQDRIGLHQEFEGSQPERSDVHLWKSGLFAAVDQYSRTFELVQTEEDVLDNEWHHIFNHVESYKQGSCCRSMVYVGASMCGAVRSAPLLLFDLSLLFGIHTHHCTRTVPCTRIHVRTSTRIQKSSMSFSKLAADLIVHGLLVQFLSPGSTCMELLCFNNALLCELFCEQWQKGGKAHVPSDPDKPYYFETDLLDPILGSHGVQWAYFGLVDNGTTEIEIEKAAAYCTTFRPEPDVKSMELWTKHMLSLEDRQRGSSLEDAQLSEALTVYGELCRAAGELEFHGRPVPFTDPVLMKLDASDAKVEAVQSEHMSAIPTFPLPEESSTNQSRDNRIRLKNVFDIESPCVCICGYAGTGKTSVLLKLLSIMICKASLNSTGSECFHVSLYLSMDLLWAMRYRLHVDTKERFLRDLVSISLDSLASSPPLKRFMETNLRMNRVDLGNLLLKAVRHPRCRLCLLLDDVKTGNPPISDTQDHGELVDMVCDWTKRETVSKVIATSTVLSEAIAQRFLVLRLQHLTESRLNVLQGDIIQKWQGPSDSLRKAPGLFKENPYKFVKESGQLWTPRNVLMASWILSDPVRPSETAKSRPSYYDVYDAYCRSTIRDALQRSETLLAVDAANLSTFSVLSRDELVEALMDTGSLLATCIHLHQSSSYQPCRVSDVIGYMKNIEANASSQSNLGRTLRELRDIHVSCSTEDCGKGFTSAYCHILKLLEGIGWIRTSGVIPKLVDNTVAFFDTSMRDFLCARAYMQMMTEGTDSFLDFQAVVFMEWEYWHEDDVLESRVWDPIRAWCANHAVETDTRGSDYSMRGVEKVASALSSTLQLGSSEEPIEERSTAPLMAYAASSEYPSMESAAEESSFRLKPSKQSVGKEEPRVYSPEDASVIYEKEKLAMKKAHKHLPSPEHLRKLCCSSELLAQWLSVDTCTPSTYRYFSELTHHVWGECDKDDELADKPIAISMNMMKLRALLEMIISTPVDAVNQDYSDLLDSVQKCITDTADPMKLDNMIRQLSNPRRLLLILSLRRFQSRVVAPILVQGVSHSYRGLEPELYDWLRESPGTGESKGRLQDVIGIDAVRCQCAATEKWGESRAVERMFSELSSKYTEDEYHEVSKHSERIGTDELFAYAVCECAHIQHPITVIDVFDSVLGDIGAVRLSAMLPELPSLKKLYLWQAEIGDIGAAAIAAALPKCRRLIALDLHGNWIGDKGGRKLVEGIAESKTLKAVFLHRNPIGPAITEKLTRLTRPYSSHVSLKVVYVSKIEDYRSQAKFVTTRPYVSFDTPVGFGDIEHSLEVVQKHFRSGDLNVAVAVLEDGAEFPSGFPFVRFVDRRFRSPMALMELCRLGSLLHSRRVTIDASVISFQIDSLRPHTLRKMLYGNSRIEYLRVCYVRNLDAISLAEVLPQCISLTYLEVHCSDLDDEGASAIAEVLPHCRNLKKTYLSSNRIGFVGATAIAEALPLCTTLSAVKVDHNRFGDDGITAIAEALPYCPAMSSITLRTNKFGDKGVEAIARALPKCVWWTDIDLQRSQIGDEGARAIADALPSAKTVSSINLRDNQIGNEGATAIAAALPQCPALSNIDLDRNEIGDGGAISIAKALPDCMVLSRIDLDANQIGDAGAVAIADALPDCEALSTIYLRSNEIGDIGAKAIAEALPRCNTKLKIYLFSNKFSATGKELLNPFKDKIYYD